MASNISLLDSWLSFIDESRFSRKKKEKLRQYVTKLIKNDFPVIWNLQHLGKILGIEQGVLSKIVNSPNSFYRNFKIPKRRGGLRELVAPYPVLLEVQRWILSTILCRIKVSPWAHGFIKKRSIISNAQAHLGAEYLLKVDITDFFPSIRLEQIITIFQNSGYNRKVSFCLARLCCLDERLPQGAASSPMLSNIIAKRLNRRLAAISEKWNLIYTRYADDMSFSGRHISSAFIRTVRVIVRDERFMLNEEKTKLIRGPGKKIVTGISVSSDKLRIPKETKRKLRQEVFFLSTRGLLKHTAARGISDPLYIDRLFGKLLFWKQIEPDNPFVLRSLEEVGVIQTQLESW